MIVDFLLSAMLVLAAFGILGLGILIVNAFEARARVNAAEPLRYFDPEEGLTLNDVVSIAHANATAKGFHKDPKSFGDDIALIHTEVSEAMEAYRMVGINGVSSNLPREPKGKPEGVPSELADVVIRVADVCGQYGIDLEAAVQEKLTYNAIRTYRHGGKHL